MVCRDPQAKRRPMVLAGLLRAELLEELRMAARHIAVGRPVRQLDLFGLAEPLGELHGLGPLVRLLDHAEARGGQGVPDLPELDLDQEEPEVAVGVLVEPLDGLAVLVAGARHDPDDDLGALAGGVRDHLAEMVVVGVLELVLDDHLAARTGLLRVDVHVERSDRGLRLYELELDSDRRPEGCEVLLLGQPLGEVVGLMRPHLAQGDLLDGVQVIGLHPPPSRPIIQCRCRASRRQTNAAGAHDVRRRPSARTDTRIAKCFAGTCSQRRHPDRPIA